MGTFYLKQNDRVPVLQTTLTDSAGVAVDLTGATTIKFRARAPYASTYLVDAAGAFVTKASGIVSFTFADGVTDLPGFFRAEWIIDEGLASEKSYPNYGYDFVYIERNA